jgi:hypothetical protein
MSSSRSRPARIWAWLRADHRRGIALGIATVSILGSVVAWQASKASGDAGGLDGQALADLIQQQQERAGLRSQLAADRRLLATYAEHLASADALETALSRPGTSPERRRDLAAQVQAERALANTEYSFFQISLPVDDGHGGYELDQGSVRDALAATDARVRPQAQSSLAHTADNRARRLTLASTLFVAGLFFLTLGQLARTSVRRLFASAGAVVGLGALVLFLLT